MLDLIVAWLPILLILGVVIITGRYSMRSYSTHVARVEAINNELVEMNRDMVAELREIKQILKDQK